MFEVGFSEILMVGLVGLLVIGPERLPKVARIAGLWLGKAQRKAETIKAEINAELYAEEFRQLQQKVLQDQEAALLDINSAAEALLETKSELPRVVDKP